MSSTEQATQCKWGSWLCESWSMCHDPDEGQARIELHDLKLSISQSLSSREQIEWDRLASDELSLHSRYLSALTNTSSESLFWVQFHHHEQLVGISLFTIADFHGPSVNEHLGGQGLLSNILGLLKIGNKPMSGRVLICGHSTLIGRPAFLFHPTIMTREGSAALIAESLHVAAKRILSGLSKERAVDAVLFSGDQALDELKTRGFVRFQTEPKLKMSLSSTWNSFDDYLTGLTSKYRVKMKRAYTKSAALVERRLSADEVESHSKRLKELYHQVSTRASLTFNATEIDVLPALMRAAPQDVFVHGYELGQALIGFRVSLYHDRQLIAHLVGLDYAFSLEHALYPRILNDYLSDGIKRRVREIDFGRTAGEIKTTLGASPESSSILLRHHHPVLARALPSIARRVELSPFKVHSPFKSTLKDQRDELPSS